MNATSTAAVGQAATFTTGPDQSTRGPRDAGVTAGSFMTGSATYSGRWRNSRRSPH